MKKFDYANDIEQLTDSITTWRPPTKEEDERKIIELAKEIQKRKWYQRKKHPLNEMMVCAYRLNNIHK